jgi:hypothetical protein
MDLKNDSWVAGAGFGWACGGERCWVCAWVTVDVVFVDVLTDAPFEGAVTLSSVEALDAALPLDSVECAEPLDLLSSDGEPVSADAMDAIDPVVLFCSEADEAGF